MAAVDILSGRADRKGLVQFKEPNSLNKVLPFSSLTRKGLGLQLTLTLFYNSEHPPLQACLNQCSMNADRSGHDQAFSGTDLTQMIPGVSKGVKRLDKMQPTNQSGLCWL